MNMPAPGHADPADGAEPTVDESAQQEAWGIVPAAKVDSAVYVPEEAAPIGPGPSPGGRDVDALKYEMARLPRDVTASITWYMEKHGVSQRQLAASMGVTPGRVSQILSGDENLTLRTLAAVCVGLAAHFEVDLVPNKGEEAPRAGNDNFLSDRAVVTDAAPPVASIDGPGPPLVIQAEEQVPYYR